MSQIFSPLADTWLRLFLVLAAIAVVGLLLLAGGAVRSDYITGRNIRPPVQPVPFSHKHHVSGLGLDCRYCHTSVEVSAEAGFPPTHTCMTCHSQIWTGAPMLAPVRQSLADHEPLHWKKVSDLPDYVYFHHDIHIRKGVGCVTCHGRIDLMPLTYQAKAFEMRFCIDCHRDPAPNLRPRDRVFDMDWQPKGDRRALGERLMAEYGIDPTGLTNCYVCHR
jgi:hypothetical protein